MATDNNRSPEATAGDLSGDIDEVETIEEYAEILVEGQEIPRSDWKSFFDEFSRMHSGEPVFVETCPADQEVTSDQDVSVVAQDLPLAGISTDPKGSDAGAIEIMLGEETTDHITHTIQNPKHVWLYQTDQEDEDIIEIESEDNLSTLVHFS